MSTSSGFETRETSRPRGRGRLLPDHEKELVDQIVGSLRPGTLNPVGNRSTPDGRNQRVGAVSRRDAGPAGCSRGADGRLPPRLSGARTDRYRPNTATCCGMMLGRIDAHRGDRPSDQSDRGADRSTSRAVRGGRGEGSGRVLRRSDDQHRCQSESAHRTQPELEVPGIGFHEVVGVLLVPSQAAGAKLVERLRMRHRPP